MSGDLESRCVRRVCGADGAVRYHPHRTLCTSNAPDDGRMYPKYVELRIYQ